MKKYTLLVLLIALVMTLSACAPEPQAVAQPVQAQSEGQSETQPMTEKEAVVEDGIQLTIEELVEYNGKNGMPAYLAHDGIIYDVTDVPQWSKGEHNGIKAGTDITGIIEKAPHGVKNLKLGTPVGKIVE